MDAAVDLLGVFDNNNNGNHGQTRQRVNPMDFFRKLCELVGPLVEADNPTNNAVSVKERVCTC